MAAPSVSYTFSNGTAADATQVNTNFTDVINGLTDGTKDLTFAALSCSSITSTGNVTLGNGASDDITISGSLAASVAIKTNNSYDIGSATLGLGSVYYGSAGGLTTRLIGGATSSSYTLTTPPSGGSDGYVLRTSGSGVTYFQPVQSIGGALNYSLTATVAANALTVALKGADGSDPSASNRVTFEFRNATLTTGTPSFASTTSATSVVVSSGSTLGHTSGIPEYVYVYAINNAGAVELAVAGSRWPNEGDVVTTVAEGGAGAADSKVKLYSTSARTGVAYRLIGRIASNQATAGTWASSPTEITLSPSNQRNPGFYASSYLIGVSPISGTPSALGEYRCYWKNAGTHTNTTSLSGSYVPTLADGMTVRGNVANGGTGASTDAEVWQIYVGLNKKCTFEWYSSTGRSGGATPDTMTPNSSTIYGTSYQYIPSTGIAVVDASWTFGGGSTTTTRKAGFVHGNFATYDATDTLRFDIYVEDIK